MYRSEVEQRLEHYTLDGHNTVLVRSPANVLSLARPSPDGARLLYRARTMTADLAEVRLR